MVCFAFQSTKAYGMNDGITTFFYQACGCWRGLFSLGLPYKIVNGIISSSEISLAAGQVSKIKEFVKISLSANSH